MNRREMLFSIGGCIDASTLRPPARAIESVISENTSLGIEDFSYNIRSRAEQAG